jgi:hypothetical protein
MRIDVTPMAVIASEHITDEVVAAYPTPGEVRVVGDAGIQEGDADIDGACGDVPGRRGLNSIRFVVVPLSAIRWVIRHECRKHEAIGLGILDIGQRRKLPGHGLDLGQRQAGGQPQHMAVAGHRPLVSERDSSGGAECLHPGSTGGGLRAGHLSRGPVADDKLLS